MGPGPDFSHQAVALLIVSAGLPLSWPLNDGHAPCSCYNQTLKKTHKAPYDLTQD